MTSSSESDARVKVFVSYQFREQPVALELSGAVHLTNADLDAYDQRVRVQVSSEEAAPQKRAIESQIAAAEVVVCLVGPTTATSSWVGWELEQALASAKRIVVLRLDAEAPLPEIVANRDVTILVCEQGDLSKVAARLAK